MTTAQPRYAARNFSEPTNRENVEVIGWLVEQQNVDAAEENLREKNAQLETARERSERHLMQANRNAEAVDDGARARFERVSVVRGDAIFEPRRVAARARSNPCSM